MTRVDSKRLTNLTAEVGLAPPPVAPDGISCDEVIRSASPLPIEAFISWEHE